jgi:hypothetical protein
VHDVVDLVGLEAEDLGEAAADLVVADHALRAFARRRRHLGGGDGDGVEVVVPELAGGVAALGVVAEVGAVGVPLADGGAVGEDGLLGADEDFGAEHGRAGSAGRDG